VWLAVSPSLAGAQTSAGDKAMAEHLFDRGLALMRQGQFSEACTQLEQSEAIERGIGTMLYLAECYEKLGRTASAWAMFREAASAARAEGQAERAKTGSARADRLEPQLSKLTVHVVVANAPAGLAVLRNGELLPSGVWGVPVPVDPGEQHIEARAPGRIGWSVSVNLPANGATLSVDVPELALAQQPVAAVVPVAGGAMEVGAPAPAAAPVGATSSAASAPERTWQKPLALIVGGVGIVGLGVGAYFSARAISKTNELDKACPEGSAQCDPSHRTLQDEAHSAATAANVFVISGAVLLAGGVVLYLTSPSSEAMHVAVRAGGGTARVEFGGTL
jgi:serine/threonine-protein kinase